MGRKLDFGKSNFLKANDCEPPILVTIADVKCELVGREREEREVCYFRETNLPLVLNKTNGDRIADIVGSFDLDQWIDKKIVLFSTTCDFAGKTVDCVRVRAPRVQPDQQPVGNGSLSQPVANAQQQENDIPF